LVKTALSCAIAVVDIFNSNINKIKRPTLFILYRL